MSLFFPLIQKKVLVAPQLKGKDYYNIHRKFKVHSSNIFVLGAKSNIARWQPPLSLPLNLTAYPTLPQGRIVKKKFAFK